MKKILVSELRRLLQYEPETGILRWRISRHNFSSAGSEAGSKDSEGYLRLGIGKQKYRVNRVIWALVTGAWPVDQVDHADRDRANNRWKNLRLASHGENVANCKVRKDSRSGLKGVQYRQRLGKFQARIGPSSGRVHLGYFATAAEAHAVYFEEAKRRYGEFARAS